MQAVEIKQIINNLVIIMSNDAKTKRNPIARCELNNNSKINFNEKEAVES